MDDASGPAEQARLRERRWFVVATAILLLGGIPGGVAVGVLPLGGASFGPVDWLIVLGIPFGVAVLALAAVVVFVRWRRRRGSALFAPSPLWELPRRRDRAALVKALRRGRPIAPEQRDLARRVARDLAGRRNLVWLYLALAVIFGANAALQQLDVLSWLMLALVPLYLGLAGYMVWLVRRMGRIADRLDAEAAGGT